MTALGLKQPRAARGSAAEAEYFAFIASLPSVISMRPGVEVCHVRYADAAFGKPLPGVGRKPDVPWVLPLTPEEHRTQHAWVDGRCAPVGAVLKRGERGFWRAHGFDPDSAMASPLAVCMALHSFYIQGRSNAAEAWLRLRNNDRNQ